MNNQNKNTMPETHYTGGNHAAIHEDLMFNLQRQSVDAEDEERPTVEPEEGSIVWKYRIHDCI